MLLVSLLHAVLLGPAAVQAAWGYTEQQDRYIIDSGSSLVIEVNRGTGDMTSIKYRGVEYNGYTHKNSQVESGLKETNVQIEYFKSQPDIIKVTIVRDSIVNYLLVRQGEDNVYILTNKGDGSIEVQRYIVRLAAGLFPSRGEPDPDCYPAGSTFVEAHDVSIDPATQDTHSKHYSGKLYGRVIDFDYVGLQSDNVGVFMVRSRHEKASGGPFFRSLQRRIGEEGADLYEIYYYPNSQTDVERFGLQGPSVLAFTCGEAPSEAQFARNADWSWMDQLGIIGWVPESGRAIVGGVGLDNMKDGFQYVAALSNEAAQYWSVAAPKTGEWYITQVLPGTYNLTIYKGELEVHTASVTVGPGDRTPLNTITCNDPADTPALWRIGDWDGTPKGLLNFADTPMKPTYMHPSDHRLAPWSAGTFYPVESAWASFPGYMWSEINNGQVISFHLTADQLTEGRTVRIGITEAVSNGRPSITINNWASKPRPASRQSNHRSLTIGTYRGNNIMFTWNVPASAWIQDPNAWQVLTISVISESGGKGFLSAGISIDAIDLI